MRDVALPVRQARRYLGLELAGAKNEKTAVAALEYYPKEQKTFLLDIFDKVVSHDHQTGDEALLEVLEELSTGEAKTGVNVPLTLPPCLTCSEKTCSGSNPCGLPAVKWMRDFHRKYDKSTPKRARIRNFTPYTQRPVELWVRHHVFEELADHPAFEIDEAMGGNKAPLAARMHYLRRFLQHLHLIEAWPKLSVAILARQAGVSKRAIGSYRHLEEGAQARSDILEKLAEKHQIFIYERDLRKLSNNLASFDAFICALTALLSDTGQCTKMPTGFPLASGWIEYPKIHLSGHSTGKT